MGYQQQIWAVMAKKGKRGKWRLKYLAATRRTATILAIRFEVPGSTVRVSSFDNFVSADALKSLMEYAL